MSSFLKDKDRPSSLRRNTEGNGGGRKADVLGCLANVRDSFRRAPITDIRAAF